MAAGELVARADAGEDAVGDADRRALGRDEAADLGHQREQRSLADVRALAGHVGAGDEEEGAEGRMTNFECRMCDVFAHSSFEIRHSKSSRGTAMPLGTNVPSGSVTSSTGWRPASTSSTGSATTVGPHVAARAGQLGEAGEHVDFGQRVGGGLQPRRGGGDQLAELREDVELEFLRALFGGEDFFFVFLELRA